MDAIVDLQRWQQAFEDYPIANTWKIEKQLAANIAGSRERLRGIVGGNYRELLSTAEQIVSLDKKARQVEQSISELGQQCSPPDLTGLSIKINDNHRLAAQLRLLQRCQSTSKTTLQKGGLLQCSELIVISRLLLKPLEKDQPEMQLITSMQKNVVTIRRQLIQHINITLTNPQTPTTLLIEASCAYCVVTSASSVDVLKHLLDLRLKKLQRLSNATETSSRSLMEMLSYMVRTTRFLKAGFGRKLQDALGLLQKQPLLERPEFLAPESLGVGPLRALLPADILLFTPYFKRVASSNLSSNEDLDEWWTESCHAIEKCLQRHVTSYTQVSEILELRGKLYSILLPVYFSINGSAEALQLIQRTLNQQIEVICVQRSAQLRDIAIKLTRGTYKPPHPTNIWRSQTDAKPAASANPSLFLQNIKHQYRGGNPQLLRSSQSISSWITSHKKSLQDIQAMKTTRWRDILEEPDDDQEDSARSTLQQLSQHEPDFLTTQFISSFKDGSEQLEAVLMESINSITSSSSSSSDSSTGEKAATHLRLIRESLLPFQRSNLPDVTTFSKIHAAIPRLHQLLADEILTRLKTTTTTASPASNTATPALPDLPSPTTFQVLLTLSDLMLDLGSTDLWSKSAIRILKRTLLAYLFSTEQEQEVKTQYIHSEFDEEYLKAALSSTDADSDMAGRMGTMAIDPSSPGAEYWTRTKTLFGMLAD